MQAAWEACNAMTVRRLGMTDHGPVHVAIVANIALKLLRNLVNSGVFPSVVKDFELSNEDAEVIVVLASLFHDIANSIHRDVHDLLGPMLAKPFLEQMLIKLYEPREAHIIMTEVMSAMVSHSEDKYPPLTVEAGVVRLADALDMEQGRARISYTHGKKDVHSISAMSIESVKIGQGDRPIEIEIKMSNPAGIFQVDYLLKRKLKGSGLEQYVKVRAVVEQSENSSFIDEYVIE
ncbi:MAG: HD domain-containing protein [Candidatus Woesearchaeota archaeon]